MPVWAQAAAAILVLAVSAGVANIQVRSGADGFVVTTGWMAPSAAAARDRGDRRLAATPLRRRAVVPAADDWKAALVSLEQQLRKEIRSGRSADAVVRRRPIRRRRRDDQARAERLLDGERGAAAPELALRLTQFDRDVNMQRQADLVRIQQLFGHSESEMIADSGRC